jgi:hypothetical protein
VFFLAAVSFPILGIDFLCHHSLAVDVANMRLSPSPSPVSAVVAGGSYADAVRSPPATPRPSQPYLISGRSSPSPASPAAAVSPPAAGDWLAALQRQFPKVFFQGAASPSLALAHGMHHVIQTVGQLATAKFWQLDPARLAAVKQEFQAMLDECIIRQSSSQWSSPLHMVLKKDGSWRPCGDYRQLNLRMVEDKYPLPNMADLAARLDGYRVFSKLDLRKGYLQVPVAAGDIAKTAIITPFGLFEFTLMPFRLCNAGMTFQRLMDSILGGFPFAFVYLRRRHSGGQLRRDGSQAATRSCLHRASAERPHHQSGQVLARLYVRRFPQPPPQSQRYRALTV